MSVEKVIISVIASMCSGGAQVAFDQNAELTYSLQKAQVRRAALCIYPYSVYYSNTITVCSTSARLYSIVRVHTYRVVEACACRAATCY